jgi:hypothetical protein
MWSKWRCEVAPQLVHLPRSRFHTSNFIQLGISRSSSSAIDAGRLSGTSFLMSWSLNLNSGKHLHYSFEFRRVHLLNRRGP